MHKICLLALSIILLSMLFSVGCSQRPSDDTVAKAIQTKIAADPATRDSDVKIYAKNGQVTLTGTVKNTAAQGKIEEIARNEPGVTGIDDQTSIQSTRVPEQASNALQGSSAPQTAAAPPPEKPKPQPIVVPAGTVLTVRVNSALGSKTSQTGQTFLATLAQPVSVGGTTAVPAGSTASGTVVEAKAKGKIKGEAMLKLALTSITVKGHTYPIETVMVETTEKGKGKRTAATTAGGAAGGALIGGLAGGGKGAGIGLLVGAGAGLVGGAMTGNKQIEIPAESALSFKLSAPVTVMPTKG